MTDALYPRWKVRQVSRTRWGTYYKVFDPRGKLFGLHANFREAVLDADRMARVRRVALWPDTGPLDLEDGTRALLCEEYVPDGETLRWVNIYNRYAVTQQPIDVYDCLPLARWLLSVHCALVREGVINPND